MRREPLSRPHWIIDTNVDNNYGADGGNVTFSGVAQRPRQWTYIGRAAHHLFDFCRWSHLDGRNRRGDGVYRSAQPRRSIATANDTYTVHMVGTVDGGSTTLSFSGVGFNFIGGNDPWAGFEQIAAPHNDLFAHPGGQRRA